MRIADLFPFGDVDATVIARAGARFPAVPVEEVAAAMELGKSVVGMLEGLTEPLDRAGLSPARWRLLTALLLQAGPTGATVGELAGHLGIREPTVTATVDRAERAGQVLRRRDEADRRVVRVEITEAGRQEVGRMLPVVARRARAFVGALGGPGPTRRIGRAISTAVTAAAAATPVDPNAGRPSAGLEARP